ncbi:MAG: RNA chaperone Hfq [Bacillota bacterium]|nr:RNA chaperone Hfq [Bacillota bacterium]
MQSKVSLQEILLNQTRKDKTGVTIFLANGFQLKGFIKGFDSFTVVIESEGRQQMIYKHAISTIIPARPVDFQNAFEAHEEGTP